MGSPPGALVLTKLVKWYRFEVGQVFFCFVICSTKQNPTVRLCHGTQRQNRKVLHAQKKRGALRRPRLFCGRWTVQFCLCVPWHRRNVGRFWSKDGRLTAQSTTSNQRNDISSPTPNRPYSISFVKTTAPGGLPSSGAAVLTDFLNLFCKRRDFCKSLVGRRSRTSR